MAATSSLSSCSFSSWSLSISITWLLFSSAIVCCWDFSNVWKPLLYISCDDDDDDDDDNEDNGCDDDGGDDDDDDDDDIDDGDDDDDDDGEV